MVSKVGAFNQEKALVGTLSMITNLHVDLCVDFVSSSTGHTWAEVQEEHEARHCWGQNWDRLLHKRLLQVGSKNLTLYNVSIGVFD